MYRRLLFTSIIILLVISILTGCGSATDSKSSNENSMEPGRGDVGYADGTGTSYSKDGETVNDIFSDQNVSDTERKLIKNGTIAIEVINVENTYLKVTSLINDVGGYEFSSSFTDNESYKRMSITIKMPPEKIDYFKDSLKDIVGEGKITSSNIYSDDISEQYYDSKSRLQSLTISRDRLIDLLKKAEETKDVLEIEKEITIRNAEIDSIQGRLNMWDQLVSMATITLYIDQINDPIKHTKTVGFEFNSFSDIWNTIKNGFISVVNILYSIIVWIFIALIVISPLLIIAIIVFIIIKRKRKNKKERIIESQNQ